MGNVIMEMLTVAANEFLQQLGTMKWSDYLDIILVAFLIYRLLPMFHSTSAIRVVKVVVTLLLLSWITEVAHIYTLNFLLDQVLTVGVIALIILFQPELRRAMDHLGNVKLTTLLGHRPVVQEMDSVITQTVMACEIMSRDRVGALIVFGRETPLDEFYKTGTIVDATVSEQLIRNIFFTNAALHDGGMIISNGRIAAAGCVLPLTESTQISADLGTRHRAGIGTSEATDAVVVIVSEETGIISVAVGGMLKRHLAPQTLERLLRQELHVEEPEKKDGLAVRLRQKIRMKEGENDEK